MSLSYLAHCRTDSPFYEPPGRTSRANLFTLPERPLAWLVGHVGEWQVWSPPDAIERTHGWKIHVSATEVHAEATLRVAAEECIKCVVPFKFVAARTHFLMKNAKYADRSASGKFITIYPSHDEDLARLAEALDERLAGTPHPYILSDVRHREGPVFFRYGGFRQITVPDEWGSPLSVIPTTDGRVRPDQRGTMFAAPSDVNVPQIVAEAIATYEREGEPSPLDEYATIDPLHYSNSGGVYRATRHDGSSTLIREARPHAGLDFRGRDALARLDAEQSALESLADLGLTPRPLRRFRAWEHVYLETEYLAGATLSEWIARNHPFHRQDADATAEYAGVAKRIIRGMEVAVDKIHASGHVVGDIHPGNIMVDADLSIKLIDLEDSRPIAAAAPAGFNVLGYRAPSGHSAAEADWFAVSRCAAAMFIVDFALEILAPTHWQRVLSRIQREFGDVSELIEALAARQESAAPGPVMYRPVGVDTVQAPACRTGVVEERYADLMTEIALGIQATRSQSRTSRYPGDVGQERGLGCWDIATGDAGVILALARMGVSVPDSEVSELAFVSRYSAAGSWGLFDGKTGIAATLYELGDRPAAMQLLREAGDAALGMHRADLYGGMAGIGLGLTAAAAATESAEMADAAGAIARALRERLGSGLPSRSQRSLSARGGLLHGWSGVGYFLAEFARVVGCEQASEAAHALVERDLDALVEGSTGALGVLDQDGRRSLPYLEEGSAGVLIAVGAVRELPGFSSAFSNEREGLRRACSSHTYAFSGLFRGRAGMIPALLSSGHDVKDSIAEHVSQILHTSLRWRETLQFAGDNYLRLSADVSTGSSGILLALSSAQKNCSRAWLPTIGR